MKSTKDEQTVSPATPPPATTPSVDPAPAPKLQPPTLPREIGGRDGPEPTRFGDWEKAGRCIDF